MGWGPATAAPGFPDWLWAAPDTPHHPLRLHCPPRPRPPPPPLHTPTPAPAHASWLSAGCCRACPAPLQVLDLGATPADVPRAHVGADVITAPSHPALHSRRVGPALPRAVVHPGLPPAAFAVRPPSPAAGVPPNDYGGINDSCAGTLGKGPGQLLVGRWWRPCACVVEVPSPSRIFGLGSPCHCPAVPCPPRALVRPF